MIRRTATFLLVIALMAGACSLGEKEEWAELARGGFELAQEAGTSRVSVAVALEPVETNIRELPEPLFAKGEGVADFDARRARVDFSEPSEAAVLFDDLVVYVPRSEASRVGSEEAWAAFDLVNEPSEDIDANDRRRSTGVALISPTLAVELLDGLLTGSMESAGAESRGGVEARRFDGRLAPDAAIREIDDEDRREGVDRLFETLGTGGDVFNASVWVDEQERVRGVRFVLRQQKDRVNIFEMTIDWSYFDYGIETDIEYPDPAETVTSDLFREFIAEYIRELV